MTSINHIPKDEQIHYIRCGICNHYFDCRNLAEVFAHEHERIQPELLSQIKNLVTKSGKIRGILKIFN